MFLFMLGLISKVVCGGQHLSKLSGPSRFQRALNSILIADAYRHKSRYAAKRDG
jgi:hypothetical protein